MSGLYFLLFLVGIAMVAVWFVRNDRLAPGEPTKGILRMSSGASPPTGER